MTPLERFRFKSQVEVRHYETDWQGIVHNANYLLYFETGRLAYLRGLGVHIDPEAMRNEVKIVVARHEIDYRSPAHFGEILDVYTRIALIRDTSFAFEGLLLESKTSRLVAEARSVQVWLDSRTNEPVRVPESFRREVRRYEGKNVAVEEPTYFACF